MHTNAVVTIVWIPILKLHIKDQDLDMIKTFNPINYSYFLFSVQ